MLLGVAQQQTSELRWHPLLKQWVGVAALRQDRPQMPENWCPFCPGSGRVPDHYDVYLYPNDFPAFSFNNAPYSPEHGLVCTTGAQGACDVVLYSPDHHQLPSQLTVEQWTKVIGLWTSRTAELAAHEVVQYVQIFENTGVAIGVTMPHPHGQIYAFPFLPPLVQTEIDSAAGHYHSYGECLYCRIVSGELEDGRRVVASNDGFVAFLPFFGRFPTEISIYPRRHFGSLAGLAGNETEDLASIISIIRRKYDNLYGFQLPLMMMVRQEPTRGEHPYFHFHVEFLPIQRSAKKLKYLAGVESGTGTFLNDTRAEEEAAKLREIEPRA
jgi:UDPglucose--hexose-1-phosphate uridylyltransferase